MLSHLSLIDLTVDSTALLMLHFSFSHAAFSSVYKVYCVVTILLRFSPTLHISKISDNATLLTHLLYHCDTIFLLSFSELGLSLLHLYIELYNFQSSVVISGQLVLN